MLSNNNRTGKILGAGAIMSTGYKRRRRGGMGIAGILLDKYFGASGIIVDGTSLVFRKGND